MTASRVERERQCVVDLSFPRPASSELQLRALRASDVTGPVCLTMSSWLRLTVIHLVSLYGTFDMWSFGAQPFPPPD